MRKNKTVDVLVRNIDELAILSDEELKAWENELNGNVDRSMKKGWDLTPVETELAYVQREWQIRNQRAAAHSTWVEQVKRQLFEEERNLPVFTHSEPFFPNERFRSN